MEKNIDLVSLFEQSLRDLPEDKLEEIGVVVQVGDNICRVHGLNNAVYHELIDFEGGNQGIVLQLDEDIVSIFLLHSNIPVNEREIAKRTGKDVRLGRMNWQADSWHIYGKDRKNFEERLLSKACSVCTLSKDTFQDRVFNFYDEDIQDIYNEAEQTVKDKIKKYDERK